MMMISAWVVFDLLMKLPYGPKLMRKHVVTFWIMLKVAKSNIVLLSAYLVEKAVYEQLIKDILNETIA